ncbi:hypothetical protein FIV42_26670 [Persicimonas caeni]|uniref:Uncharacterized protein n=1 Tax=Persicimonas caeni TaxID=2292766 RepID=A0A4Y6Q0T9_PERCE|nr:FG-GAP repeat protein [Persicimonas caeni]QDG54196.1 hypothetical protein FIV42_26670 [Persicimonas caeni]QED35417.1 hypothetical protein FRD00_26665 [Persicimonas caeni]
MFEMSRPHAAKRGLLALALGAAALVGVPASADATTIASDAEVTSDNVHADDEFGAVVAVDGDLMVVGAPHHSTQKGKAYIFARDEGGADAWGQVAELTPSRNNNLSNFGQAVAIDGDTVVFGAPREYGAGARTGEVFVFARNEGGADAWGEVTSLAASDAADNDFFGRSLALEGDTLVVGASGDDDNGSDSGAVYIFERDAGTWSETVKLAPDDTGLNDQFGKRVALEGDTLVVAADDDTANGENDGAVYIFGRNEGGLDFWGDVAKLSAPATASNPDFGDAVAIASDYLVVGADAAEGGVAESGAAYVYGRDEGGADNWGLVSTLVGSGGAAGDAFGRTVALSADALLVGAERADARGTDSGVVYLFEMNAGQWTESQKLALPALGDDDLFGSSVAIDADTFAVGATTIISEGSVYMFRLIADTGGDAGVDAGPDAGPDAGVDAGADIGVDTGPSADTGTPEDTGADVNSDIGVEADAGDDAGSQADAGGRVPEDDGEPEDEGCACSSVGSTPGSAAGIFVALVALIGVRRRLS